MHTTNEARWSIGSSSTINCHLPPPHVCPLPFSRPWSFFSRPFSLGVLRGFGFGEKENNKEHTHTPAAQAFALSVCAFSDGSCGSKLSLSLCLSVHQRFLPFFLIILGWWYTTHLCFLYHFLSPFPSFFLRLSPFFVIHTQQPAVSRHNSINSAQAASSQPPNNLIEIP